MRSGAGQKGLFEAVKEQNTPKWEKVRAIKGREQRAAAAKLKLDQKADYAKASGKEIDQARKVKDKAWKTMTRPAETRPRRP